MPTIHLTSKNIPSSEFTERLQKLTDEEIIENFNEETQARSFESEVEGGGEVNDN